MGKVITQNLQQIQTDADGITTNQTGLTAGDVLPLDGVLTKLDPFLSRYVSFREDYGVGAQLTLTTGLTGSTATVTIVGRGLGNEELTETVTLPGASSTVTTTNVFTAVFSMTINGTGENVSVGVDSANDQYGPWINWDHWQNGSEVSLEVVIGGTTPTVTLEHTLQEDLYQNGYDGSSAFPEGSPFATMSTTQRGILNGPFMGSRIAITAGTGVTATVRFLYSGGGQQ